MILRPEYVDKIITYMDTPFVKILTGVRRCGKSTIMKMLRNKIESRGVEGERIIGYNFDSLEYEGMTAKALYSEIKEKLSSNGKTYLFLDEIQEIDGWEKVVNSLMSDCDVDIYVTGSNSRMMSSEISTYLTGRYISFRIYPLSFSEYLSFRKEYTSVGDPKNELARYLQLGGFPAIHLREYTKEEAYPIVKDIYNSTVFTDIVKRNNIRKVDQFERVVRYVFDNVGNTFSASSVTKYLKSERRSIDNETVYNYLSKLESAYILHRCERFDIKGKEILKTQEKFYLSDPAFLYSVLGYNVDSISAMLENIVYLELLRRGYDVCVGKNDSFEIDFIATRREEKIYVQVAKEIGSESTREREYNRLLEIEDNYPKYVLLYDDRAGGNYKGIKTVHIADFLLSKEF
ncbi:MAG: ATP-binding protein [Ruminococcaceae bacterium]|nr:ATP-binding protein [Oscillospiraceae bacterium]